MKIDKDVLKELDSFEVSELQRVLEAVETQEYYYSGYKNLNGGYASAEAYHIEDCGYYDEEKEEEFDSIELELESGVQDIGRTSCTKVCLKMPRPVLGDKVMSLKEKLATVEDL